MSIRVSKLLPVVVAFALCGLAQAGNNHEFPSIVVKYGDLDLATKADVSRLHARLRGAAKEVCSPLDSRVLGLREQFDLCVSDALTRGVSDVGNPSLTRFHRYGRHVTELAAR